VESVAADIELRMHRRKSQENKNLLLALLIFTPVVTIVLFYLVAAGIPHF
jgi:hypothetical protein